MVPTSPESAPAGPSTSASAAVPLPGREAAGSARVDDEADLVRRATAGDEAAFKRLYEATAGRVFALCLRMTGESARARELTHDVFVRAWERLATFRGESAFGSWLHRLAVNVVLADERAARRRRARVGLAGDEDVNEDEVIAAGGIDDPDARMDLDRAIALLPPNARRVFVLHDVQGYRHEEIARLMSLAEATVRVHLHRARRLLMERLSR